MQADQAKFLLIFFADALAQEFETTRKVIKAIPEGKKEYRPHAQSRNAIELAWHMASSDVWFLEGILQSHFGPEEGDEPAREKSVADVVSWYERNFCDRLEQLRKLPVEKLIQPLPFFGMFNYPAVAYLMFLTVHSVHHRGQLSTYLRPMGSTVPSIYGGSADEPFNPAG
ncbi:MAG: DinB family protein [Acidobacteria bacterium]|nr:DinB family protein [Acidobacteriota bacterium]